jgi:hypothetical protein
VTDPLRYERIIQALWPLDAPPGTSVWAILDAARDDRIYPALRNSRLDYLCLYSGRLQPAIETAAPYLVELAPQYGFTRQLIDMGWGQSWGVFLRIADASNLRYHLRTFLRVRDESGRILFFRYYDPRVLRAYLPTCRVSELAAVFGPIESFLIEDEQGESLTRFAFDGEQLQQQRVIIAAQAALA